MKRITAILFTVMLLVFCGCSDDDDDSVEGKLFVHFEGTPPANLYIYTDPAIRPIKTIQMKSRRDIETRLLIGNYFIKTSSVSDNVVFGIQIFPDETLRLNYKEGNWSITE